MAGVKALLLIGAALLASFTTHQAGEPRERLQSVNLKADQPAPPIRHSGKMRGTDAASLAEIRPPERFTGDGGSIVLFLKSAALETVCGRGNIACAGKTKEGVPVIAMPNPCLFPTNAYAAVLCHEVGHTAGWGGEHGA